MSWHVRDAHPHLLPWYAAGRLDAAEARMVEEHLKRCEECAAVAGPLASISRSLSAAAKEHVEVEELANWEAGRMRGEPARSARIEAHLAGCAACGDDLAALRGTKKLASIRKLPAGWWLAAAAAAILLGVALPIISSRWGTPEPGSIVLLPASRVEDPVPTIDGSRRWSVGCVLPYSATSREYAIRLERDDGSVLRRMGGALDGDARISLVLDPISEGGLYRIVLEPVGRPLGATHVYRIRVQP